MIPFHDYVLKYYFLYSLSLTVILFSNSIASSQDTQWQDWIGSSVTTGSHGLRYKVKGVRYPENAQEKDSADTSYNYHYYYFSAIILQQLAHLPLFLQLVYMH